MVRKRNKGPPEGRPNDAPPEVDFSIPSHCYYSSYVVALLCLLAVWAGKWYESHYSYARRAALPSGVDHINAILSSPHPQWGTFRANNFFGLKDTSATPLMFGIMWFAQLSSPHEPLHLRHWCANYPQLRSLGWTLHDGRNCGVQQINETDFTIETSFVKANDSILDSRLRIRFLPRKSFRGGVSLLTYAYHSSPTLRGGLLISGSTSSLGQFHARTHPACPTCETSSFSLQAIDDPVNIEGALLSRLVWAPWPREGPDHYVSLDPGQPSGGARLVMQQTTSFAGAAFYVDVVFEAEGGSPRDFDSLMGDCRGSFHHRFAERFPLAGMTPQQVWFSKYAVSSLVGGVSHFRGRSVVGKRGSPHNTTYFEAQLISAVPSRVFFPRGFLWDEGFHCVLLSFWDPPRVMEIVSYWFDLMNADGWIPREQILGRESSARVPADFIRQTLHDGNPPTFFLALESLIRRDGGEPTRLFLAGLFPRLKKWLAWYVRTQSGPSPDSFRWHGRAEGGSGNPLTLMSGLDDYPRASTPTDRERHLDLHCWMAHSFRVMARIARLLGENSRPFQSRFDTLSNLSLLDALHWSPALRRYSDFGLDGPPGGEIYRFVDSSFGYVNIFPLLLEILPPNCDQLGQLLRDIDALLLTPFGLSSLSRDSPYYRQPNTPADPPYWRGDIWININYMALRALSHYIPLMDDPSRLLAADIYRRLRDALVENVHREFVRSGFVWERYDDRTGRGKGVHPFTGWSSLIVLIMAENYH